MNRTIILYQSRYGTTELCAKMLQKTLQCDIQNTAILSQETAASYDTIIYIGYVQVGKIKGFDTVKETFLGMPDKHLILCAVGLNDPQDTAQIEGMWDANLDTGSRAAIRTFYLTGGFDFRKMKFFHRKIIGMIIHSLAKKENKSDYDNQLLAAREGGICFVTEDSIAPIKEYVLSL